MYNAGDFNTTETVNIPVNTFDSNDPTASVTVTDLAVGDIEIHKDGSTTQRSSDAGVTVTINFDSVTGNHMIHIDLSDNTDAGFYSDGSRYLVRIEGVTVDSGTLNAWIGGFSIGCILRPTTAGRTLDVEAGGCAGVDWANVANPTSVVDLSATDIQLVDTCTANTDLVSAASVVNEWETQSQADPTGFHVNVLEVNGTAQTGNDNGADINAILTDTNEIQGMLPSKTYLTGTNNSDGDIQGDEMTGEIPCTLSDAAISTIAGDISTAALEAALGPIITAKLLAFGD